MKFTLQLFFIAFVMNSCSNVAGKHNNKSQLLPIEGTWKLLEGTLTEKGKSVRTDYRKNVSFIKIINGNHFAFLQHDINKGKDSAAVFVAGGGPYNLSGNQYTEHLEYCNGREWEGKSFTFTISIINDTLVQHGREVIESKGIDRLNTETYIRIKK